MAFRLDRAPLVDFCNQNSPRAHPRIAQSPSRGGTGSRPPALSPRSAEASPDDRSHHLRERMAPSLRFPRSPPFGRAPFGAPASRENPAGRPGTSPSRPTKPVSPGGDPRTFEPDANRAPPGRAYDHQPRFHGPGAGMLGCQPHLYANARAVSRAQPSAHGRPRAVTLTGDWRDAATPTRSARTPLVVRSQRRRVETPTLLDAQGRPPSARRIHRFRGDPEAMVAEQSHHASPSPAKGRNQRAWSRHA